MNYAELALAIGYFVVWLALWVLVLRWLYLGLRRCWRSAGPLLGEDPLARLLGLGAAVALFRGLLGRIIAGTFQFCLAPLKTVLPSLRPDCKDHLLLCLSSMGSQIYGAVARAAEDLSELPWETALLMVVVWAALAHLLSRMRPAGNLAPGPQLRAILERTYAWTQTTVGRNLSFFLVLGFGSYLSFVAVGAIPKLQEQGDVTSLSPDKLQQRLNELLPKDEEFKARFPEDISGDPIADAQRVIEQAGAAAAPPRADGGVAPSPDAGPARAEGAARPPAIPPYEAEELRIRTNLVNQIVRPNRDELVERWRSVRSSTRKQQIDAEHAAVTTFEIVNLDQRIGTQRAKHFLAIDQWYRERMSALNGNLESCLRQIRDVDTRIRRWTSREPFDWLGYFHSYDNARDTCVPLAEAGSPPSRPRLGEDLHGPFASLSWLLDYESLPLALVVGMLGFGLLGAAISTFVREYARKEGPEGPLVEDLAGIVIRGLSAAIIIFLGVKGGLAVFSSGSMDPNPYVLLFTCLAAAVFSEDVWKWVYRKFSTELGKEGEGHGQKEAQKQEQEPAKSAPGQKEGPPPAAGLTPLPPVQVPEDKPQGS